MFFSKEWLKNKFPILSESSDRKRFFDTRRRKCRHGRATARLSDKVYRNISKRQAVLIKSRSYYLTIPKVKCVLFLFIFCLFSFNLYGQITDRKVKEIVDLGAKKFDVWIDKQEEKRLKKSEFLKFDVVGSIINKRLKNNRYTTDYAILKCLSFYKAEDRKVNADRMSSAIEKERVPSGFFALNFIDELLNIIHGNEYLKMRLLKNKADLIGFNNESEENKQLQFEILKSFSEDLSKLNLSVDLMESDTNLEIGDYYNDLNNNKKMADQYYIKVLVYPFSYMEGIDYNYFKFRSLYLGAAEGRIRLYHNDLLKLKYMVFVDNAAPDLFPLLKTAIEGLGGDWNEYLKYWEEGDFEYNDFYPEHR